MEHTKAETAATAITRWASSIVGSTYSCTRGLPGARCAAGSGVFRVECKGHDVVAVAGEETLPLVDSVHNHTHPGNVIAANDLRCDGLKTWWEAQAEKLVKRVIAGVHVRTRSRR